MGRFGLKTMTTPLSSYRILNTEPGRLSQEARLTLRELAAVDELEVDREYLLNHIEYYDVLFICLRNVIDFEILKRAKRLKCIVTPTTGLNHIDVFNAEKLGVKILSLRGEKEFLQTVTATAELTWALLLSLARKISTAHQSVMAGEWVRDNFYGKELQGMTLGIIGYGRLGKMLGRYGRVFGMHVLAYDTAPSPEAEVEFTSLTELLGHSDVISVHLPLTDSTYGLLDRNLFSKVKRGAIFINTSRGEIVNEAALLDAMRDGLLSGAALDVMAGESTNNQDWLKNSLLFAYAKNHDNLLITPHIGGVTFQSVEKTNRFMIDKLASYLREGSIT